MPPKTASVDGITKQAIPAPPHSTLNEELDKEKQARQKSINQAINNQVKASKSDTGPALIIVLTVICMILLIGLAYFAYNKSK
ncbi:MAG: hypothetical protein ACYCPS_01485 [Candidatus Saccharimonadales bacterium]